MSRQIDAAAERLLSPLAETLRKTLTIVDARGGEASDVCSVSIPLADRVIVSSDELSPPERRLIQEAFDLVRQTGEDAGRLDELRARVARLERENLDLIVRNRILSEVTARDPLTGLFNRWYVIDKMEAEINRSLRHASPMALLMIDIDHFKRINDTYGHPAGDQVLRTFGTLLRESCRIYDVPGRYGGEEFCVLLPETPLGNTPIVAERIRHRLEMAEMKVSGNAAVGVTASIGIAGLDNGSDGSTLSAAALIDRADRALYAAKSRGRNRVELWDSAAEGSWPVEAPGH